MQVGDKIEKKLKARQAKEQGNKAFSAKKFEEAIKHFTTAIEADPRWGDGWMADECIITNDILVNCFALGDDKAVYASNYMFYAIHS